MEGQIRMSTHDSDIRTAMMQHLEDAANLCRQLSKRDQPFYLAFALLAWERNTGEPLTEEEIEMMVLPLQNDRDDVAELLSPALIKRKGSIQYEDEPS
jgi:hypothetical protein